MAISDYLYIQNEDDCPGSEAVFRGYPDGETRLVLRRCEVDEGTWDRIEDDIPQVSDYYRRMYEAAQRVGMSRAQWVETPHPLAELLGE